MAQRVPGTPLPIGEEIPLILLTDASHELSSLHCQCMPARSCSFRAHSSCDTLLLTDKFLPRGFALEEGAVEVHSSEGSKCSVMHKLHTVSSAASLPLGIVHGSDALLQFAGTAFPSQATEHAVVCSEGGCEVRRIGGHIRDLRCQTQPTPTSSAPAAAGGHEGLLVGRSRAATKTKPSGPTLFMKPRRKKL